MARQPVLGLKLPLWKAIQPWMPWKWTIHPLHQHFVPAVNCPACWEYFILCLSGFNFQPLALVSIAASPRRRALGCWHPSRGKVFMLVSEFAQANGCSKCNFLMEKKANWNVLLPFIVTEFVAVVISGDDVNQQDVLGLGVHSSHFNLVTRKHPP